MVFAVEKPERRSLVLLNATGMLIPAIVLGLTDSIGGTKADIGQMVLFFIFDIFLVTGWLRMIWLHPTGKSEVGRKSLKGRSDKKQRLWLFEFRYQ